MSPFSLSCITCLVAGLLAGPALAQGLPIARPDEVGLSPQRLSRIGDWLRAEVAAKRVPGAVVAIARQGRLVYFKAFGQADPVQGKPMRLLVQAVGERVRAQFDKPWGTMTRASHLVVIAEQGDLNEAAIRQTLGI